MDTIDSILNDKAFLKVTNAKDAYRGMIRHVLDTYNEPSYESRINIIFDENPQKAEEQCTERKKYVTQLADICFLYDCIIGNKELKDHNGKSRKIETEKDLILLKALTGDSWNDPELKTIYNRFRSRRNETKDAMLTYTAGIDTVLSYKESLEKYGRQLGYFSDIMPLKIEGMKRRKTSRRPHF